MEIVCSCGISSGSIDPGDMVVGTSMSVAATVGDLDRAMTLTSD